MTAPSSRNVFLFLTRSLRCPAVTDTDRHEASASHVSGISSITGRIQELLRPTSVLNVLTESNYSAICQKSTCLHSRSSSFSPSTTKMEKICYSSKALRIYLVPQCDSPANFQSLLCDHLGVFAEELPILRRILKTIKSAILGLEHSTLHKQQNGGYTF